MRLIPVAICVPVRDEEADLPHLLAALAGLRTEGARTIACFHLDGCTDGSEAVIRDVARSHPLPIHLACGAGEPTPNAGLARRNAMALGLAHIGAEPGAVLLATDADSTPERDWLTAAVAALGAVEVAAGRVERQAAERDPGQGQLEDYYDRLHRYRRAIDPVSWDDPAGFHYTSGANLAVRASVYEAVGGFRPLPAGEDAIFADDAARAGFRVARVPAMIVRTSSRRAGRAIGGLAATLRALDGGGTPMVAHPASAAWQYRAQAAARRAYADIASERRRAELGRLIGIDGDHILGVARDCPNAEAFAMRVVPAPPGHDRAVSLDEAEVALAELELGCRAEVA